MPLTDVAVRNARGREKPYKLTDGDGLYLLVKPDGGRYWRYDYRYLDKRKTLALGVYPTIAVSKAREKHQAARALLAAGSDPGLERKKQRVVAEVAAANTFKAVAEEWIEKKLVAEKRSDLTIEKVKWQLTFAYPEIGTFPIDQVEAPELLQMLRGMEQRGLKNAPKRLRSSLSRIFRYAIATGRASRDPAAALVGALTASKITHHAALFEPKAVGGLLRAIDDYGGERQVSAALKLAPIVFVRPAELRKAEWTEIDLEGGLWRIPGWKMKKGLDHIVPLATQAIEILKSLKEASGSRSRYVFASLRTPERPMSENTINAAFRRLGYSKDEVTGHGLRRTASTLLNEMGWNRDWIERQLAHVEGNTVRRVYNAAEYLPDRIRMMQAWADHLDVLRKLPAS
jgi:hypothetical protein